MARIRANQEAEKRVAWPAKPAETDPGRCRPETGFREQLVELGFGASGSGIGAGKLRFVLAEPQDCRVEIAETARQAAEAIGSRPRADRATGGRAGFAGYGDGEIGRNKRSGKRQWRGEIQCEDRDCAVLGGLALALPKDKSYQDVARADERRSDQRGTIGAGRALLGQHVDGGSTCEYAGEGVRGDD